LNDETIFEAQLTALMRVVAAAFAVAGLVPAGPSPASFPVIVRRQILRMLGPAEAALRRLIRHRARAVKVSAGPKRAVPNKPIPKGRGGRDRIPPFRLFDPRKWFWELAKTSRGKRAAGPGPRISNFDDPRPAEDVKAARTDEADIDPAKLCRRLQALYAAMNDIPAQAKRMARMMARRAAAAKSSEPLRRGPPPGHRETPVHEIDEILAECHMLALRQPKPPDKA